MSGLFTLASIWSEARRLAGRAGRFTQARYDTVKRLAAIAAGEELDRDLTFTTRVPQLDQLLGQGCEMFSKVLLCDLPSLR
jgi:hypothetical protein